MMKLFSTWKLLQFFSVAHHAASRVCVLHVNSLTTVNILVLVSLYVPNPFPF